ncbi:MAG: outer membrane lipoprotein-sorting protein [Acidobacteriota bacterium]
MFLPSHNASPPKIQASRTQAPRIPMPQTSVSSRPAVLLVAVLLAFLGLGAGPALADADLGLRIAREADARAAGYGDSSVDLTLILRDPDRGSMTHRLRSLVLEKPGAGGRSLVVLDSPEDPSGTAVLTVRLGDGTDEQWLYLSALGRVSRLASSNRSGPFLGSELSYEDLWPQGVDGYTYRFLREEDFEGTPTFVVERAPVDPSSGYTRQVVWFDREEYRILRIVYYDRKGDLLKTLVQEGFRQHLDRHWRPSRGVVENHQTGRSTELRWGEFAFGNGYVVADFDHATLGLGTFARRGLDPKGLVRDGLDRETLDRETLDRETLARGTLARGTLEGTAVAMDAKGGEPFWP